MAGKRRTTHEIAHAVASAVEPALEKFRYFKSYTQARRKTGDIVDDIIHNI